MKIPSPSSETIADQAGPETVKQRPLLPVVIYPYKAPSIVSTLEFLAILSLVLGVVGSIGSFVLSTVPIGLVILGAGLSNALGCFVFSSIIDHLAKSRAILKNIEAMLDSMRT